MHSGNSKRPWALPLWLVLGLCVVGSACEAPGAKDSKANAQAVELARIGYQKSSVLVLLKWKGTLEEPLRQRGIQVQWAEFPTGPAVLEALNAGQLDLGYVGEAPPIFAQAASREMVYVAVDAPSPRSEAILVPRGSPITELAQLKGKSVALNKGSNVHYFLLRALASAGLAYRDVNVVFLAPADARAAFENGTIDAWAIWDPYLASAEVTLQPSVLATAQGIADNNIFYVARRGFADAQPELLAAILGQVRSTDEWAQQHRAEVASYLGPLLGLDERAIQLSVSRASWGIRPIDEATVQSQQRIADAFYELGLLPAPLRISDALPKRQAF
jgi:sulfonate transport system substrate-binding protein